MSGSTALRGNAAAAAPLVVADAETVGLLTAARSRSSGFDGD